MEHKIHDFAMEKRLRRLDPTLHRHFADAVFAMQHNLFSYKRLFPEYTDHTTLHSLSVIDFCNQLIGDQIDRLNADELYVLLSACYFHDAGMGITMKDYEAFLGQIDYGDYFESHSREDIPAIIRDFHHEFSSLFIQKYAPLFDFPSEEHTWAIRMVSRGHRETDLMNEQEYPLAMRMPDGNSICLPYLAALIRLADEIDVTAARNSILLYDIEALTDEVQIMYNRRHRAVRDLLVTNDSFILTVDCDDEAIWKQINRMVEKMQRTLEVCRAAVQGRTPYAITQERVIIGV